MNRRMRDIRGRIGETDRKCPADIGTLLVIAGYCLVMAVTGLPCPILFFTGVSCAGCGMTRAWLALLRLDLQAAIYYHPMFCAPAVMAVLLLLKKRIPKKLYQGLWMAVISLMYIVYLLRMVSGTDTIVVFHPKAGFVWRVFSWIRSAVGW